MHEQLVGHGRWKVQSTDVLHGCHALKHVVGTLDACLTGVVRALATAAGDAANGRSSATIQARDVSSAVR